MSQENYNLVETLLDENLKLSQQLAITKNIELDNQGYIHGQAMANVLFDIHHKINSSNIDLFETNISRIKEQLMFEAAPMAYMNAKIRKKFFIDYCLWSRLSDHDIDLNFLKSSFTNMWNTYDIDVRNRLLIKAYQFNIKWRDLI